MGNEMILGLFIFVGGALLAGASLTAIINLPKIVINQKRIIELLEKNEKQNPVLENE